MNLSVTLIDVGWGDSILLESEDKGKTSFALIDSNDTSTLKSSYIFLKRYFEKKGIKRQKPLFDFVLLTHAHTDHGQGLKYILREFGAEYFWYSKTDSWGDLADLLRYANKNVKHHEALSTDKAMNKFGSADVKVLWPPRDTIDKDNENNNSIVLALKLGDVSFVLTGDAEAEVWDKIAGEIPGDTRFFKVPHHGSVNGTFDGKKGKKAAKWFDKCPKRAYLGISSHIRPFKHPSKEVIGLFDEGKRKYYRTDEHYHITVQTDGKEVSLKYSRI